MIVKCTNLVQSLAMSLLLVLFALPNNVNAQLRIEGIIDGPLGGGTPKAVEFYVITDIADLSLYGFGSANNGGGTEGQEFTFSGSAVAGQSIFVASEAINFLNWFGFSADFTSGASNINGDDAIELFYNGSVVDVFGDINVDGSGQPWEYLDGWAKRISSGPDGSTFVLGNWTFSGRNALDGETDNATASDPYPGMYLLDCVGDAGPDQVIFVDEVAQLAASSEIGIGEWSGGAGTFSDVNDPNATYTPDASEENTSVELTWTIPETYQINRTTGATGAGSVTGYIVTDGTIGTLAPQNIISWELNLTDGVNSATLTPNDSYVLIEGTSLSATDSELIYTFAGDNSRFYIFDGAIPLYDFYSASGGGSNYEAVRFLGVNDEATFYPLGPLAFAQKSCGSSSLTTTVGVFGYPDAEFFFDPAMICPRMATEYPQHSTGIDGAYTYEVLSGGPFLDLEMRTGIIESDNSDIGVYTITNTVGACGNLAITGVIDGPLGGGNPKAVELTALNDIPDLSTYSLDVAFNGSPTSGQYVILDQVELSRGDKYYVAGSDNDGETAFESFFGFPANQVTPYLDPNGDDVIILSCYGVAFDVFGELGVDGSGETWEYLDGWAYRNSDTDPNVIFNSEDWTYSGSNALDGSTDNSDAMPPMPVGTYGNMAFMGVPNDVQTFEVNVDYDAVPFPSMNCLAHINVSIDPAICGAEINYLMLLPGLDPDACLGYDVQIEGLDGNTTSSPGVYQARAVSLYDGNYCWTTITVEDKKAPIITCVPDVTISCADPNDPESLEASGVYYLNMNYASGSTYALECNGPDNANLWGLTITECSCYDLSYQDAIVKGKCEGDIITRTFTATDEFGLVSTCTQTIFLAPEELTDIALPSDFDCTADDGCADRTFPYGIAAREEVLACDGAGVVWNALENGLPSPYDKKDAAGNVIEFGTGKPSGVGTCGTIDAGYTDIVIDICTGDCVQTAGSYKVIRQWTMIDWCSGTIIDHNQIIKVLDIVAPEIEPLDDVTISSDLWSCGASYDLPRGEATDNCSEDVHVTWTSSAGTIEDGVLTLSDKTMPGEDVEVYVNYADCCGNSTIDTFLLAVRDLVPPVVVTDKHTVVSMSLQQGDGLTKIFVETFDDGSFDNCGAVELSVRRLTGTCTGFKEESKYDREHDDVVHFCCKDVGKLMRVEIQVCDDANMNGIFGSYWDAIEEDRVYDLDEDKNPNDNCNISMVEVEVQDKLAPICLAPEDKVVDCIFFADFTELVNDGELKSSDAKKVDAAFGEAIGVGVCDSDTEQELVGEEECGFGTITRKFTLINDNNGFTTPCEQKITVTFDPDKNFLTCDDITFPEDSEENIVFTQFIKDHDIYGEKDSEGNYHPYYPNKIWCLMNPFNVGEENLDGENLPAIVVADCAEVTITAPEINIVDLCSEVGVNLTLDTFNFAGGGCKKILAHWEIIDQCLFVENYYNDGEINPFVPENGYFEMYVEYDLFDTEAPEITCGDGFTVGCDDVLTGELTASAVDNCTDPSYFGWTWELTMGDEVFNGEGNTITAASLGMETFAAGEYSVNWSVTDGCGNGSNKICDYDLEMLDTKAPTPYCIDGLATAVMETDGTVSMWASDFDAGSSDDCSSVFVSIIPEKNTEGLDDISAYVASLKRFDGIYGWIFDCSYIDNGVSQEIPVRMYATDEEGNYDYCTTTLRLNDNLDACQDTDGLIADLGGNIATVYDMSVGEVEVEAFTSNPEYPRNTVTDNTGDYAFFDNPAYNDYEVSADKTTKYLEGVSTLDLIIIQKHILGIEKFTNPYKIIAANLNGDTSIKASDLLTLRKLILGLYSNDELPSQSSWIFIPKDFDFVDPTNPFPITQIALVENLQSDKLMVDFVGIKIGDVSYSDEGQDNTSTVVRTNDVLNFEIENKAYKAGEIVTLNFTSAEFTDVYGYQFTLGFNDKLEFVNFEKGTLALQEDNFGLNKLNDGIITTSYSEVKGATAASDDVLFTLSFRAKEALEIKDAISINSSATPAEAYLGESLTTNDVKLTYRDGNSILDVIEFALYQNEPNPFRGSTVVSFNLPKATNATLSIYDVTGKVVYKLSKDYAAGFNSEIVREINTSGVLYYQIDTDEFSATKKMIVIK